MATLPILERELVSLTNKVYSLACTLDVSGCGFWGQNGQNHVMQRMSGVLNSVHQLTCCYHAGAYAVGLYCIKLLPFKMAGQFLVQEASKTIWNLSKWYHALYFTIFFKIEIMFKD